MHWKTKNKLLSANKIYLTLPELGCEECYEIRIQFPTKNYVLIDLELEFPHRIEYLSLEPNGFDYTVGEDSPIVIYGKTDAIKKLHQSINFGNNDPSTVKKVIDLVNSMNDLRFR